MGQANLRGTQAERIADGMLKAAERDQAREKARADAWKQMSKQERLRHVQLVGLMTVLGRRA